MILTYEDCIKKYGSDYLIKKEIEAGNLFKQEKGYYSLQENCDEMELILAKYPRAIFTGESAYYLMKLSEVKPDKYVLATKRTDSRIKDKKIKQVFANDEAFDIGKTEIEYKDLMIPIYSLERLLVDLIRFKSKYPFDYYKEIIRNYREITGSLDFYLIEECASKFKMERTILESVQLEVL